MISIQCSKKYQIFITRTYFTIIEDFNLRNTFVFFLLVVTIALSDNTKWI